MNALTPIHLDRHFLKRSSGALIIVSCAVAAWPSARDADQTNAPPAETPVLEPIVVLGTNNVKQALLQDLPVTATMLCSDQLERAGIHSVLDLPRTREPGNRFESEASANVQGNPAFDGQSSAAVSSGYFIMVAPLSKGQHTIHFKGKLISTQKKDGADFTFTLDITYPLTVE